MISDRFTIHGFHHVEFWCFNVASLAFCFSVAFSAPSSLTLASPPVMLLTLLPPVLRLPPPPLLRPVVPSDHHQTQLSHIGAAASTKNVLSAEQIRDCKELGVLVDCDDQGVLLQIVTNPLMDAAVRH